MFEIGNRDYSYMYTWNKQTGATSLTAGYTISDGAIP